MDKRLVTTAFTLEGYRIVENLGVVRGIVVRSRSVVGNFAAGVQSIFGGNISVYAEMCDQARRDALIGAMAHADERGGNAIIGMRYDATDVMAGITEVLCYGTAVRVEPVS